MRRLTIQIMVLAGASSAPLAAAQDPLELPRALEILNGSVRARGRVVFIDLEGNEHLRPRSTAKMVLSFREGTGPFQGKDWTENSVEVIHGNWSAWFDGGGTPTAIAMTECTIDSETVRVEPERIALTDGADLVFRVYAIPELLLRVVDAATRGELDKVAVIHDRDCRYTLHPGVGGFRHFEPLIDGAQSPVILPATLRASRADAARHVWVRAADHAWRRVDLSAAYGGTREVALARCGSLDVTIRGPLPEPPATVALRLYRDRQREAPGADFEIDTGKIETIEGLAPGVYEARVELGGWHLQRVLAKGEAVIEAGATTKLALRVQELTAPPKSTVRGTLALPPQWLTPTDTPVSLVLIPLDYTRPWAKEPRIASGDELVRDDKAGVYRFSLQDVFVDGYELVVWPGQHRRFVRVPESGIADLRVEVPPPAEVVLRVLDGETKKPRNLNGWRVWWITPPPEGVRHGMPGAVAAATADPHEVRFLAPVGPIVVSARGEDYEVEDYAIDVRPGRHEVEVTAKSNCGVKIELYEGSIRIPLSPDLGWRVQLASVAGEVRVRFGHRADSLTVLDPGRYILKVETPDDYQPVTDRVVTLSPGPFPTVEIKVKRTQ